VSYSNLERSARRRASSILAGACAAVAAAALAASVAPPAHAQGAPPSVTAATAAAIGSGETGQKVVRAVRTETPPVIDGKLDDPAWNDAPWSDLFVDIEGDVKPRPRFRTRAKMLWDDDCFYIAAEMEEPHVWATLTKRDSVIFHDNDFEVFIDPDGDTENYYELEINAINNTFDLFLPKPYRKGGKAQLKWDIKGLKSAVSVMGTVNNAKDKDKRWILEIAIPFESLSTENVKPVIPADGSEWRINFSRVNWQHEIGEDGRYMRKRNAETGKIIPEYNWVWSPQGIINMHYPEYWGKLVFSGSKAGKIKEVTTAQN